MRWIHRQLCSLSSVQVLQMNAGQPERYDARTSTNFQSRVSACFIFDIKALSVFRLEQISITVVNFQRRMRDGEFEVSKQFCNHFLLPSLTGCSID